MSSTSRVVTPATRLRGEIQVPGDKSITHRGFLLGSIGNGRSRIRGSGLGADTRITIDVVRALGADVESANGDWFVTGRGLHQLREPTNVLDCGNSGTTMRLTAGLLAGRPLYAVLTGDRSLRSRPMDRVIDPLSVLGARIEGRASGTLAPLTIRPSNLCGADLDVTVASAQVKSAIALAALRAEGPTRIRQPSSSRDHTERILLAQGASLVRKGHHLQVNPSDELDPLDLEVPGDISSAAFWIVAAVLHPDAEVVIHNVGLNPSRTGLLDALNSMGADIDITERTALPEPIGTVVARSSSLAPITVRGELLPRLIDEVPLLALAATSASGASHIYDARELRYKESDRLQTTAAALSSVGLSIDLMSDGFSITGPLRATSGEINSEGDHRIAMLAAIAGITGTGPVTIHGSESVNVSYPMFWHDLARLVA